MWSILLRLKRNYENALKKHPNFPEKVVNPHTTYLSMTQNRKYFRDMNDAGKESIASIVNEEVSELLCEMYKRRWRRAEREWLDVVTVLLRTYFIIRKKKKERYNEIMSWIRYKRMLRYRTIEQRNLFKYCDICPHYSRNVITGVRVCGFGLTAVGGICPLDTAKRSSGSEVSDGVQV